MEPLDDFKKMLAALPAQIVEALDAAPAAVVGDVEEDAIVGTPAVVGDVEDGEAAEPAIPLPPPDVLAQEEALPALPGAEALTQAEAPTFPDASAPELRPAALPEPEEPEAASALLPDVSSAEPTAYQDHAEPISTLFDRPEVPAIEGQDAERESSFLARPEIATEALDMDDRQEEERGALPSEREPSPWQGDAEDNEEIGRAEGGNNTTTALLERMAEGIDELVRIAEENQREAERETRQDAPHPPPAPAPAGWQDLFAAPKGRTGAAHSFDEAALPRPGKR